MSRQTPQFMTAIERQTIEAALLGPLDRLLLMQLRLVKVLPRKSPLAATVRGSIVVLGNLRAQILVLFAVTDRLVAAIDRAGMRAHLEAQLAELDEEEVHRVH